MKRARTLITEVLSALEIPVYDDVVIFLPDWEKSGNFSYHNQKSKYRFYRVIRCQVVRILISLYVESI